MTEIERKALELVKEVECERVGSVANTHYTRSNNYVYDALCRAIEQHEIFRQEVSDAVLFDVTKQIDFRIDPQFRTKTVRFIITKPDPLVEALRDSCEFPASDEWVTLMTSNIRAALAKRGLEIREKSDD